MQRRAVFVIATVWTASCTGHGDLGPTEEPTPPPVLVDQAPPAPLEAKVEWVRPNTCGDGSPMSLTAADGTGLQLRSLRGKAFVEGPLAFTELELEFVNPEPRQIEGRFSIQLPPRAALSRFAMKLDERWQEGEVVERKAAQRAYEDFLHRRQDPALLENDAGNVFAARVFPIPPSGSKHLILSYSQELTSSSEPYRLPLCGLPELGSLDVDVAVRQGTSGMTSSLGGEAAELRHLTVHKENYAPTVDLEVHLGTNGPQGLRHENLALARITPKLDVPAPSLDALTIAFDTSASRALGFDAQVDRLGLLVAELDRRAGGDLQLIVACVDQTTTTVYRGPANGFGKAQLAQIRERGALGATDLEGAMSDLLQQGDLSPRLLLLTDGIATMGATEDSDLAATAASLRRGLVERIDVLVDGGIQDVEALAAITTAGLAQDGVVLDARVDLNTIASRLMKATRSGIGVEVSQAEWVWPTRLDGIQPGDEVLVFARLPEGQPMQIKLVGAGVAEPQPMLAAATGPLLARAHARARIESLTSTRSQTTNPDAVAKITQEIIDLSTSHRVLSDETALLVLETEQDYERYGILRRGLADILSVGATGIEVLKRSDPQTPKDVPSNDKPTVRDAEKAKKVEAEGFAENKAADAMPEPMPIADPADFDDRAAAPGGQPEGESAPPPAPPPPPAESAASPMPMPSTVPAEPARIAETEEAREFDSGPASEREGRGASSTRSRPSREEANRSSARRSPSHDDMPSDFRAPPPEKPTAASPWTGRFQVVMEALGRGDKASATREAEQWRREEPGDVLALIALGEVEEAKGDLERAARVYGSLIDLFPSRADLRRMAGERLERLGGKGLELAVDTYRKAREQRPDHPSSHRLYAFALAKAGRYVEAFRVIDEALGRAYPYDRLMRTETALREDLGVLAQVIVSRGLAPKDDILITLQNRRASLELEPSLRFILVWETDANDVDFHIYDGRNGHAYYSQRQLPSGGTLFDDVTNGYGPEQFAIEGKSRAFPYTLQAHYYSRGPMGYGMGGLQVMEHDGRGELRFQDRPFVIMVDSAFIDLGVIQGSLLDGTKGTKR